MKLTLDKMNRAVQFLRANPSHIDGTFYLVASCEQQAEQWREWFPGTAVIVNRMLP